MSEGEKICTGVFPSTSRSVDVLGRIGYIGTTRDHTPTVHPPNDVTTPETDQGLTLQERLLAVISAPGRLFRELPHQPYRSANWIVPWIILALSTIVSGAVMLSDPHLLTQLASIITEAIQSGVADGTFTQDEAQMQLRLVGPGSPIFAVLWLMGPPAAALVTIFALAFLFSLIGRSAMNARAPFMKIVEVVGLTSIVRALETLATLLCVVLTGSVLATPSAALLLGSLEPTDARRFRPLPAEPLHVLDHCPDSPGTCRALRARLPEGPRLDQCPLVPLDIADGARIVLAPLARSSVFPFWRWFVYCLHGKTPLSIDTRPVRPGVPVRRGVQQPGSGSRSLGIRGKERRTPSPMGRPRYLLWQFLLEIPRLEGTGLQPSLSIKESL